MLARAQQQLDLLQFGYGLHPVAHHSYSAPRSTPLQHQRALGNSVLSTRYLTWSVNRPRPFTDY